MVGKMEISEFFRWKFQTYTLSMLVIPVERERLPDSIHRKVSEKVLMGPA